MKYAAKIDYLQDQAKVESIRPLHRVYLSALLESGKLFAAGPFEDGSGALIVYEAESREAAEALLKADPFHASGVFLKWAIVPWKVVYLNPKLGPAS